VAGPANLGMLPLIIPFLKKSILQCGFPPGPKRKIHEFLGTGKDTYATPFLPPSRKKTAASPAGVLPFPSPITANNRWSSNRYPY